MEVKIFWTEFATNQLEQIFDYYKYKATLDVAMKIVSNIVERTILLEKNPLMGTKEPLLAKRQNDYRYLVEGNTRLSIGLRTIM
jgi:plasmid stabilization system protein ParE